MAIDHQVRQMMRELSRALARAIRTSSDVSEAIRKIRHQGHSPHLVLSCERGCLPERRTAERRSASQRKDEGTADGSAADLVLVGKPVPAEPAFRINGRDVALLKSMGIDPTRRGRSSRGRRGRGRRGSAK